MEVHKRNKKQREKEVKSPDSKTSNEAVKTERKGRSINSMLIMVLILLVVIAIFIFAIPGSYSGPSKRKHTTEKKPLEKQGTVKKEAAKENVESDTVKQQPTEPKQEEPFEIDNSTSCDSLMADAKQLMESGGRESGEAALDMLASCVLKEPHNAAARWNLAVTLLQLNRVQEALGFIDEALTLDNGNRQYFIDAGKLFASLKMHKEAIRCFEHYLELLLQAPSWPHLLASISIQREDEWMFLYERDRNIVSLLELLLQEYLSDEDSLIKTGYLFKVVIGLKGVENDLELVKKHAYFSLGLCDFSNGMNSLHSLTKQQYVTQGYGDNERAFDIVSTHALRLFTAGIEGFITTIARNLLTNGDNVFNELTYNCDLDERLQQVDYTTSVRYADVKRIFATCVRGQNVIPVILENGAIVYTENIFGWTPLLQVISLNDSELLFQVLKGGADVQSRTPAGMTALHIAAIKGSTSLVLPLTQAGLKATDKTALNQTAIDVACSHRWFTSEFAKSLNTPTLPQGCPPPAKYLEPLKAGYKNGGWLTPSLKLPKELSNDVCEIDVVGYNARAEDILLDYIVLQKPVLIRNATSSGAAKKLFQFWQRSKVVKEYGNQIFNEVTNPRSEFGSSYNQTSLKKFLEKMTSINEEQSVVGDINKLAPPPYIFQIVPADTPILEHFKIPSVLNPSLTEIITTNLRLHVGPTLAGISPRFHQSSWNALIYGRRKWYIYPPEYAYYTRHHVWEWWNQYRNESVGTIWECVQHPGDLLLLPDMWGCAAINLKESIGVSSEFIHGSSEFSL